MRQCVCARMCVLFIARAGMHRCDRSCTCACRPENLCTVGAYMRVCMWAGGRAGGHACMRACRPEHSEVAVFLAASEGAGVCMHACVCVCARARPSACVRACLCVHKCISACVCERVHTCRKCLCMRRCMHACRLVGACGLYALVKFAAENKNGTCEVGDAWPVA